MTPVPPRRPSGLRSPRVLALVLAALSLAGCGASVSSSPVGRSERSGPSAQRSTSTTVQLPPIRTAPEITTPTTTVDGLGYTVPTENPGQPVGSGTATGGQIIVTDRGVLPQHLFAALGQTITWTNLSSKPVRIRILYSDPVVESRDLAVGGTFTYSSPTLYNFVFVTSNGMRGQVSIGVFQA